MCLFLCGECVVEVQWYCVWQLCLCYWVFVDVLGVQYGDVVVLVGCVEQCVDQLVVVGVVVVWVWYEYVFFGEDIVVIVVYFVVFLCYVVVGYCIEVWCSCFVLYGWGVQLCVVVVGIVGVEQWEFDVLDVGVFLMCFVGVQVQVQFVQ